MQYDNANAIQIKFKTLLRKAPNRQNMCKYLSWKAHMKQSFRTLAVFNFHWITAIFPYSILSFFKQWSVLTLSPLSLNKKTNKRDSLFYHFTKSNKILEKQCHQKSILKAFILIQLQINWSPEHEIAKRDETAKMKRVCEKCMRIKNIP